MASPPAGRGWPPCGAPAPGAPRAPRARGSCGARRSASRARARSRACRPGPRWRAGRWPRGWSGQSAGPRPCRPGSPARGRCRCRGPPGGRGQGLGGGLVVLAHGASEPARAGVDQQPEGAAGVGVELEEMVSPAQGAELAGGEAAAGAAQVSGLDSWSGSRVSGRATGSGWASVGTARATAARAAAMRRRSSEGAWQRNLTAQTPQPRSPPRAAGMAWCSVAKTVPTATPSEKVQIGQCPPPWSTTQGRAAMRWSCRTARGSGERHQTSTGTRWLSPWITSTMRPRRLDARRRGCRRT